MGIEEKLKKDEILARYSTFQIGGSADFFLEVDSKEELLAGFEWAEKKRLRVFVFGAGSNLLFDDAGYRGLVIRIKSGDLKVEGERIVADAGVLMAKVLKAAAEGGLTGLEAWNGLPGTVGGAVYGNAGCFGTETKDVLESAQLFLPGNGLKTVETDFFEYGYRSSRLKKEGGIVLNAVFKLKKGDPAAIKARLMEVAKGRIQKQPAGASTGSFFKNPPEGQSAGWLIEKCGLKGKKSGGAHISEQHGNFFLNGGGATAKDILSLADLAEKAVLEKFEIKLEREVVFVPSE